MRKRHSYSKLNRPSDERKLLLRGLACEIIQRERIETTVQKAKATRMLVERIITLGKRAVEKDVDKDIASARRVVFDRLQRKLAVDKVFEVLVERYRKRAGGYTRIIRTRTRAGDRAQMVIFELVKDVEKKEPEKPEDKKAKGKKKATKKPIKKSATVKDPAKRDKKERR